RDRLRVRVRRVGGYLVDRVRERPPVGGDVGRPWCRRRSRFPCDDSRFGGLVTSVRQVPNGEVAVGERQSARPRVAILWQGLAGYTRAAFTALSDLGVDVRVWHAAGSAAAPY